MFIYGVNRDSPIYPYKLFPLVCNPCVVGIADCKFPCKKKIKYLFPRKNKDAKQVY